LDAKLEETVLIQACLNSRPFAWQKFVDRFLPIVLKIIHEINTQVDRDWTEPDHQKLATSVFDHLHQDHCLLLKDWDPSSDFESWLIIAARRIILSKPSDNEDPAETDSES